jgi:hypothetical protein
LSAPRSGSTLLASVLANHPEIQSESEPWLMLAFDRFGRIDVRNEIGAWHLDKAVSDFLGDQRQDLLARAALAIYAGKLAPGKSRFLDKTPRYYLIVDELRQMFPDARFIVLRRSPLDIAASFKTTWSTDLAPEGWRNNSDSKLFDLFIGPEVITSLSKAGFARVPCFVDYEAFVQRPGVELARIFSALGLRTEDSAIKRMLRIKGSRIDPARFGDPKIRATRSIMTSSTGSWRKLLTPSEAWLVAAYHGLEGHGLPEGGRAQGGEHAAALRASLYNRLATRRFQAEQIVKFDISHSDWDQRIAEAYNRLFGVAHGT